MGLDIEKLFDNFINIAESKLEDRSKWREYPVTLVKFFSSKKYLGETPFPGKQTELLEITNTLLWYKFTQEGYVCPEDLRLITEQVVMFGKGCKHGDTKVIEADTGKIWSMKELHQRGSGFYVTALNEDTQQFVKAKACAPILTGVGESFIVETASGHKTTVFRDHVFLSRSYNKNCVDKKTGYMKYKATKWVKVSDLKVGDSIALAQGVISEGNKEIDFQELRLLGYLIGNGNLSGLEKCATFYTANDEVEQDFCSIVSSLGITPKYPVHGNEGRPDRDCKMIACSKSAVWENGSRDNAVTEILRKYGLYGKKSTTKYIPSQIFELTEKCKIEFLKAMYATDGWVCNPSGKVVQIGYCSVSEKLIRELQLLLSSIGIMSRLYTKKTKSNLGIAYQLMINDAYNVKLFNSKIQIPGKAEKLQNLIDSIYGVEVAKGSRLGTDIYWSSIKSITPVGEQEYYDLTVDEYANYVSDGFIDHNSGKDFLASGILAYVAYLLCCMNDPHSYFNFGQDEPIDLINVAANAYQANNVFFKKLKARLNNCDWFKRTLSQPTAYNEYQLTKNQIRFHKNITAHSAHSEGESYEGFNPLMVIFDEIGAFSLENAENCYSILRSSALSRFNDKMLLMFISYPRFSTDFMMTKFEESKTATHIHAMIGVSWEVNPNIRRKDLEVDYNRDPEGAAMRYESLTGDTLIWTTEGACRIDSLSEKEIIRTVFGSREVKQFIKSGVKDVYELQTKEGYTIRGSANHPLKVYANKHNWKESSGLVWRTIGELRKGDKVYLDLGNNLYGKQTISKNVALLMGALIGDGTFQVRPDGRLYATWYFGADSNLISVYQTAFGNEFGVLPQLHFFSSRTDVTMRTDKQEILQQFIKAGLSPASCMGKKIPDSIFQQPKEVICEFIKGWADTDGSINKDHGNLIMGSANRCILIQLQQLLLMIGVRSRLIAPQKARRSVIKTGRNKGKVIDSGVSYRLTLAKQEAVVFNSMIRLNEEKKRTKQLKCTEVVDCLNYPNQLLYVTVDEVVFSGKEECYDLWVEPENEFTANGMVAHNCIPPTMQEGLFRFPEKIDKVVNEGKYSQCPHLVVNEKITTRTLASGEERHFLGLEIFNLNLDPSFIYYIGGDGGVITDSYVITLFHAEPTTMEVVENGEVMEKTFNKPVEDLILEWKPSKADRLPVDLINVADVLEMICRQVNVKKAIFDKFNSAEVTQRMMQYGVDAEDKNFSNPFQTQIYQNLKGLIYTGNIELLDHMQYEENKLNANEELKHIRLVNGNKIDHDRTKSKDISDARAGATWLCSNDDPEESVNYSMPIIMGAKRK